MSTFRTLLVGAALAWTAAVHAFPTKPVRIVVGFPAGGPLDQHARLLTDKLQAVLGQPVVVEQWLSPQQARVQWRGAHWDARLAKGHASLFGEATYIISAQEGNLLWIEPFTDIGSPPVKLH